LAPQDLPYWFGMNPVGKLALGTIRYLGHEDPQDLDTQDLDSQELDQPDQKPDPLPPGGRIRHGLIVYDGGQS